MNAEIAHITSEHVAERVYTCLRGLMPEAEHFYALHEPCFEGAEWDYVKECIDTGWVSSAGAYVTRFENDLAQFCGVDHAIAVSNGTAALHISLMMVGVERDDEVLMPSLTFIATANATSYIGAVPHFIDINEDTLGLCPKALASRLAEVAEMRDGACFNRETGRRIKAVVPMHCFGHPVDIDGILAICEKYNIELVEDAAESLGSYYKGTHTGGFGRCAALSFNGNKTITTGGGGAILTNDAALAKRAKHITTTAKLPHKWEYHHDEVGYNYRLPNINAALGCAQLEKLPQFLKEKRALAEYYIEAFSKVGGMSFVTEPEDGQSNYWLNAILLDEAMQNERDVVLGYCNENNIMTRPVWTPMHELTMYQDCPSMRLPVTDSIARRLINIPSGVDVARLVA